VNFESLEKKDNRVTYLLILVFVLLAAGFIAAGYVSYLNYEKQHRAEVERQLSAIADLKVNGLSHWRMERIGNAADFYGNEAFTSLVRRYFKNPDDQVQRQLWTWLSKVQLRYAYERLLLFDARGALRMSIPDSEEPVAPSIFERATIVMRSEQIDFQDIYRAKPNQKIHLTIMVPLLNEESGGQTLGLLTLQIDPEIYLYPYIRSWPTPSQTAETLLVRREGNEVVFLNDLRFQEGAALNLRFPLDKKHLPAVKAVLGHEGIVEGKDYREVPVIAAVRAIPDSPWFLVARMDRSEVYGPLKERLYTTMILIVALVIGIGTGIGLLWWQQHVRFYRERYEASEALQTSEEKYHDIFDKTVEGIYRTTSTGRFEILNPAFARICGYASPKEMMEKVTDIANQLYANPEDRLQFQKMITAEGEVKDLQVQFKHPTKGLIWVSINSKAIYDEQGNIPYYDGTITDITERKWAEKELQRTLESLRKALGAGIQVMVSAVEVRDPYTAGHQNRTANLARAIATEMGVSLDGIEGIRMAGSIHDIGKLSIPAEILSKPTRLTELEFSLIKEHSKQGYEMLKDVKSPWPLAEIVHQHHERMDGSGYPRHLKGDDILLEARIMAVADVVESMASHRPYRPALGIEAALEEIQKNKGTLYDHTVADACLKLFREKGFQL
jgi:PAS domain S-box-containing protein